MAGMQTSSEQKFTSGFLTEATPGYTIKSLILKGNAMRKLLICVTFLLVLFAGAFCAGKAWEQLSPVRDVETASPAPALMRPAPEETALPLLRDKPMSPEAVVFLGRNRQVEREISANPGMIGRLVIPGLGISVALYTDGEGATEQEILQNLCDREDAAAFFDDGFGYLIADHNNQAFWNLDSVQPGDRAFILRGHSILSLECDLRMDAHNYGQGIVDAAGNYISARSDYVCYTCQDNWNNVSVAGFRILDEDYVI